MLLEASAFLLEYDEMIEYAFVLKRTTTGTSSSLMRNLILPAAEFGRTRIGGRLDLTGEQGGTHSGQDSRGVYLQLCRRFDRDPAQENMRVPPDNFFQAADSASRDSLILAGSLLKYRNRGAFKADVEWDMGPFGVYDQSSNVY